MSETPITAIDRSERSGSPGLVLLLAAALVAIAAAFSFLPPDQAGRLLKALLAVLAMVGVLALFAYAVGFLQFSGQSVKNDITKVIADTGADGLLVTEGDSRVIYANEAYLTLSGAHGLADLRTIERLFSGAPEVSESIYRLAQAARENRSAVEEVRLAAPLAGQSGVGWYRIRVRPLDRLGAKRAALWSVADITRERERHENVFQELQNVIDFLDHAPAGFFAADQQGVITFMNATLAGWLDYDLAQVGSGGMKLSQLVAGSGSALLEAVAGGPGEVRTEQIDVDLKRRGGQRLPVRLVHRIAFSSDGQPGHSRTLVLSRATSEDTAEDILAAQARFARFFNSTPMAIAVLDAQGHIKRSNAAFAKLMPAALKSGEGGRSVLAGLPERDAAAVRGAIEATLAGQADPAPL
ncbi:MAG: PAS domain-containing protein, partial [Rhodoblastus sp.]|nr:PAS domain-containing protein [Rhodoblastus sp.]